MILPVRGLHTAPHTYRVSALLPGNMKLVQIWSSVGTVFALNETRDYSTVLDGVWYQGRERRLTAGGERGVT